MAVTGYRKFSWASAMMALNRRKDKPSTKLLREMVRELAEQVQAYEQREDELSRALTAFLKLDENYEAKRD